MSSQPADTTGAAPHTSEIILAAPLPEDLGKVPGFPVDALGGLPVFCLADPTVRRWVRGRQDEGSTVLVGDPGWLPGPDVAPRTRAFLADDRDLAIVAHGRGVWETTHCRDAAGVWHQLPRLEWQPLSPGWRASGDRHGYLISTGPDDRVRLTRWAARTGCGGDLATLAREVLDNSLRVTGPAQGQAIAQAYEDGRGIDGVPGWLRPGSTKAPFYRDQSDLETSLPWRAEEAGDGLDVLVDRALANQSCSRCGCTDEEACPEGCYWVAPRLCSSCALDLAGELIGQAVADLPGADQAIENGDPAPPADLPPEDRARWTARWALTVQARLVMFPGVVFHGIPDGPACQVQIELAGGTLLTRLVNPGAGYMHSPDRLSVGGRGASCTAMAHALLTAALGLDATCPACTGTGWTVWDGALGRHRALRPDDAQLNTSACTDCDGFGIGIPPRVYRAFEEHVVATMNPQIDWRLTRRQVLDWLIAESGDEALAALAMRQARHGADPDIDWAASLAGYEADVTRRHASRPGPQSEGHRT